MKLYFFILFSVFLISCKDDISDPVFEGFRLGEKFDISKIQAKFGSVNTINKHYKQFENVGIKARIYLHNVDQPNYVWDYKFSNGMDGFVSFTNTESILTHIVIIVGQLEQMHPGQDGFDDLYHIREKATKSGIQYLKASLKKKYGEPTDSISQGGKGMMLIWDFNTYQVQLLYNYLNDYPSCQILYKLDREKVDRIKEKKSDHEENNL